MRVQLSRGGDRRNVEVDHCIRRRQSTIRIFAPLEIEGSLGGSECHPREGVPIANKRLAGVQARLQRLDSLPAVCRKQQVHSRIICAKGMLGVLASHARV
jgi:hypothetical protein